MTSTTELPGVVLLVDDSALQRAHTREVCRRMGAVRLIEADGGAHALQLLDLMQVTGLPDLVITDLEMPGMDGVQLIQALKERGCPVPFVILSSRDMSLIHTTASMARALELPILGALKKPLDAASLAHALGKRAQVMASHEARRGDAPAAPAPAHAHAVDEHALTRALGDGGFFMHYQPKVSIADGSLQGVEALARWKHPDLGMVPPDQFIPLAERTGLIRELTMTAVSHCAKQMAHWRDDGAFFKPKVAINLSPLLLSDISLVDDIGAQLERHSLHPSQVVLEITEGSLVLNVAKAMAMLARLRLQGYGLSIDDYGTGFSSMKQLAQFPFTELKIDRSFVAGAHNQEHLRVILGSAIELARRLNLVTVGEGIETREDWQTLRELGCVLGQGYLISRPTSGDLLMPAVARWDALASTCIRQAA